MHIAVDAHDLVRDRRGIGTYLRAVLTRMVARDDVRFTLIVRDPFAFRFGPSFARALGVARVRVANRVPPDADVTWHPWNGTFVTSLGVSVATVHDLVPFAFPALEERLRAAQQAPFERTFAAAGHILCDSEFTASELQRFSAIARERMTVIPLGVDPAFSPGALDALPQPLRGRRYVLHVGAHDAHKNVATLAAAHARAFADNDVMLVTTRRSDAAPQAWTFENLPLPRLIALYRAAELVAVPSIYEGFGLPVLEAMACGTPVLASRAASLPEAGGDAAWYVDDPLDIDEWATQLRYALAVPDERGARREAGLRRAREFTWNRCAESTRIALIKAATR